jgi:hypothetical protein
MMKNNRKTQSERISYAWLSKEREIGKQKMFTKIRVCFARVINSNRFSSMFKKEFPHIV